MEWKRSNERFVSGTNLYLGKWKVGGVYYDSAVSKATKERYRAECKLPGIKPDLGIYETEQTAQLIVEKAVNHWVLKSKEV